jgi:hypothetical protein
MRVVVEGVRTDEKKQIPGQVSNEKHEQAEPGQGDEDLGAYG